MRNDYRNTRAKLAVRPRRAPELQAAKRSQLARDTELGRLKTKMLDTLLEDHASDPFRRQIRLAANDAASLAWLTGYPVLVFPGLFAEKVEAARNQDLRQSRIRERSQGLLAFAA